MKAPTLGDVDACFFCLGVSSAGMSEARYRALTLDITLAAPESISATRPDATFCYVSGEGIHVTTTENIGRAMSAAATLGLATAGYAAARRLAERLGYRGVYDRYLHGI